MQPSLIGTPTAIPLLAERDDALETERVARLMAGRSRSKSSRDGTKANVLTVRRLFVVIRDMLSGKYLCRCRTFVSHMLTNGRRSPFTPRLN